MDDGTVIDFEVMDRLNVMWGNSDRITGCAFASGRNCVVSEKTNGNRRDDCKSPLSRIS
jgi:hypothetical protein